MPRGVYERKKNLSTEQNKPVTLKEVHYALSRVKLTNLIEKNVPIPHHASQVNTIRELLSMMVVKDSIVLPFDKSKKKLREAVRTSVYNAANVLRKQHKELNYVTREVPSGLRVWRVA